MQAFAPPVGLANRVLEREDWARERLSAHAGRTVRMICGPIHSSLAITAGGMLTPAHDNPDLTLTISPLRLPTLLAYPERWNDLVAADGDAALASTLADLSRTLPWFVEQAFASVLGSVVGTRLADAGRALLAVPEHAARSFGASLSSYVHDEAGVGVSAAEAADFSAAVAAIAARVDALERRVASSPQAAGSGRAKEATRKKSP
jgi:ubiquinone biosynthesis accessory factor UbiJ